MSTNLSEDEKDTAFGLTRFEVRRECRFPCRRLEDGEDAMPPAGAIRRVYDPDALKIVTDAFDKVWQQLPENVKGAPGARRKLALIVMRHVNHEQLDPIQLADAALIDFLK